MKEEYYGIPEQRVAEPIPYGPYSEMMALGSAVNAYMAGEYAMVLEIVQSSQAVHDAFYMIKPRLDASKYGKEEKQC